MATGVVLLARIAFGDWELLLPRVVLHVCGGAPIVVAPAHVGRQVCLVEESGHGGGGGGGGGDDGGGGGGSGGGDDVAALSTDNSGPMAAVSKAGN